MFKISHPAQVADAPHYVLASNNTNMYVCPTHSERHAYALADQIKLSFPRASTIITPHKPSRTFIATTRHQTYAAHNAEAYLPTDHQVGLHV